MDKLKCTACCLAYRNPDDRNQLWCKRFEIVCKSVAEFCPGQWTITEVIQPEKRSAAEHTDKNR
jgi:hypothetical protein